MAAVAALTGAFGGAGLGFLGLRKISTADLMGARRAYPARSPNPGRCPPAPKGRRTSLSDAIDALQGEVASYVSARRALERIGNRHVVRTDRLAAATAQFQVLDMPAGVVAAFDEANAYLESLAEERTDALRAMWPSIYERLHSAARLLDV